MGLSAPTTTLLDSSLEALSETAQAIVLKNSDLLRLIIKCCDAKENACATCANKQWKQAVIDVEDEYFQQRWPQHEEEKARTQLR
eukprot:jgi/Chlat1/4407/Chrsp29S04620